jgi:hypothetical protein
MARKEKRKEKRRTALERLEGIETQGGKAAVEQQRDLLRLTPEQHRNLFHHFDRAARFGRFVAEDFCQMGEEERRQFHLSFNHLDPDQDFELVDYSE